MLYRARPSDGVAWVTGASTGLGRGVALELARRGFEVRVTARRLDELTSLARDANEFPGKIVVHAADVTNRASIAALVGEIEAERPIAIAFLNAGGSFADAPGDFGGEAFQRTFELNVQGGANGVNPVMTAMKARGRGQIAITGSIAGYGGLPNAGAYAPSKAAVISMAVGLRFEAEPLGITIQIVNPGYIKTPLTARNRYPMPFLMECDEACRRICDGFERGGFEIRMPRRLAYPLRLLQSLPYPLFFKLFDLTRPRG